MKKKQTIEERLDRIEKILTDNFVKTPDPVDSNVCTLGNCPYAPGNISGWGMSPEGWAQAKEKHDKYHIKRI